MVIMNSQRGSFTLRMKLGLMAIFLVLIPFLVISITYSKTVREVIRNTYTNTAIQSVNETSENLSFVLNDVEEFSSVIISNNELLTMLRNKEQYSRDDFLNVMRTFLTSRDDIKALDMVIGNQVYSIGAKKKAVITTEGHVPEKGNGKPNWIQTRNYTIEILSGEFHKYYFSLSRRIIDYNTLEDYGYMTIYLEESNIEEIYANLLEDNVGETFVIARDGTMISHSDKKKIGSTIRHNPYADEIIDSSVTSGYLQYKRGVDIMAIYSTLKTNDWKVVHIIPTNYLYQELNQLQKNLLLGGVVYAIAIIIFIMFFSFRYTEPMMKMMRTMKLVERGDFSVRTEIMSRDEVGQLGESLNNMIGEMEFLIDRLIKEEQYKREVELEALHAQINPHFLYNTLNTIKWMAKIQGNVSVSKAITALVKLLRTSTNLGRDMITLGEEIEYVKNYMLIQRLRFNDSVKINYQLQEGIDNYLIPKLILQPIVENAIIYGAVENEQDITITIKAEAIESDLVISIEDDGPGIEDDVLKQIFKTNNDRHRFSKVGLNNVNQRIKLYCGSDYHLEIKTLIGQGTTVIVRIPMLS